jgi:branched-chain amino acid transport system substrate-binding protein
MASRGWFHALGMALLAVALPLLIVGCPPPPQNQAAGGTSAKAGEPATGQPAGGEQKTVSEGTYGPADGIPVGAYLGLTGSDAAFGQGAAAGIILALEQNAKGPKVKLILQDDRGNPADVSVVLNKLINEDKVVAVLGGVTSSRSLQGAPICQKAHIPMVSPTATNPRVTEAGDFVFRTCFIDPYQGQVMARFALDRFKAKTAAMLYPQDNDYSVGLAKYFKEAFEREGGRLVADEAYGKDQKDFRTELQMIKSRNPEVLFVPCYYDDAGVIARQARELDITVPILGGDGWDSPKVFEIGKEAITNCFISNHYAKDADTPAVRAFVEAYRARWGGDPNAFAATAYDATGILIQVMGSLADPRDSVAIRDGLAKVKDYPGVTGLTTIDAQRNASKDAVVLELKDGAQTYVTTVPAPKQP